MNQERNKILYVAVPALLVAILLIGYSVFLSTKKSTVNLIVIPNFTKVTVDGKAVKPGKLSLKPGKHTVNGVLEGYETIEKTFTLEEGAPIKDITVFPNPESSDALNWANSNPELMKKREGLAGEEARLNGERFRDGNKILEQLPYRSLIFNIDYGISEKNNDDIILYVEASSPIDRQYAIAQIKDWGFDPSLYSIVFSDFSNPLGLE